MPKVSEAAKEVAKQLTDAGFSAHVIVDEDGEPVFASGWARDIIITKLDLSSIPEKKP